MGCSLRVVQHVLSPVCDHEHAGNRGISDQLLPGNLDNQSRTGIRGGPVEEQPDVDAQQQTK